MEEDEASRDGTTHHRSLWSVIITSSNPDQYVDIIYSKMKDSSRSHDTEIARDLSGPIGGRTPTDPGGNLKMSYGQANCLKVPTFFHQATILSLNWRFAYTTFHLRYIFKLKS